MFDLIPAARHLLLIFLVFSWLAVGEVGHCLAIHLQPDPSLGRVLTFAIKHVVQTHISGSWALPDIHLAPGNTRGIRF